MMLYCHHREVALMTLSLRCEHERTIINNCHFINDVRQVLPHYLLILFINGVMIRVYASLLHCFLCRSYVVPISVRLFGYPMLVYPVMC